MEQEQDQQQDILPTPVETTEEEQPEVEPTKSVKNFWERLDEVFAQSSQMKERMDELLQQFPEIAAPQAKFTSFIFQPERISLCSNDDMQPNTSIITTEVNTIYSHKLAESFSSFRIRLIRPLRNIKSIQLLSAVIPNAIQNIPDNQIIFFYYRLRSVQNSIQGAWNNLTNYDAGDIVTFLGNTFVAIQPNINYQPVGGQLGVWWAGPIQLPVDQTRPNYYDLNPYHIYAVNMAPTLAPPPEATGNYLIYNRTFQDYNDLLTTLNACAADATMSSIGNDLQFTFDATLNKFQVQGAQVNSASPNNIYYLPCGYEDPNIEIAMSNINNVDYPVFQNLSGYYNPNEPTPTSIWSKNYNLNLRLGFTWNGLLPNIFQFPNIWNSIIPQLVFNYLRKGDPGYNIVAWNQNLLTANSYADLVNTSCVRLYADFTLASTQDSLGSTTSDYQATAQGLLSVIPVNANNLGVGFYQNNFSNPLTKIPENLTEIGITMLTDQGLPYYLPNSATVLLELAVTYK